MKTAIEKVWVAEDGKTLVKDGDEKAARLVAIKGQQVPDSYVAEYKNAEKFFEDSKAIEPAMSLPQVEAMTTPATPTTTGLTKPAIVKPATKVMPKVVTKPTKIKRR